MAWFLKDSTQEADGILYAMEGCSAVVGRDETGEPEFAGSPEVFWDQMRPKRNQAGERLWVVNGNDVAESQIEWRD